MKGMVIIDSNHYGKSMEIVECLKEKVLELVENLSSAEMDERNPYPEEEDDRYYYGERRGSRSARPMPRGRYNY